MTPRQKAKAKANGAKTYTGKVCAKHAERAGERVTSNRNCVGCVLEREREYRDTDDYREYRRERHRSSAVRKGNKAAYEIRRRNSYRIGADVEAINRAYGELAIEAQKLGKHIDHKDPIAGCRVCGVVGVHSPENWQLLSPSDNSAKGDALDAINKTQPSSLIESLGCCGLHGQLYRRRTVTASSDILRIVIHH